MGRSNNNGWRVRLLLLLLLPLALLLLLGAYHLRDPHLVPLRPFGLAAVAISAIIGIALSRYLPGRMGRRLLTPLFLAAVVLAMGVEALHHYHKQWYLGSDNPRLAEVGRHFIVGYESPEALEPLVRKGIGGIFVTRRNVAGKSAAQLQAEIARFQGIRAQEGLPPLIVATDQEGGIVSRLSPPLPKEPALATLAERIDAEDEARQYGHRQGSALAALGITVNFSPVVDLRVDHPDNPLDFHSLIARRAISSDPQVTARVAGAYVEGMESTGVRATLKHFPGLGGVTADTHHFSAELHTPLETLRRNDWLPFRQVSRHSEALIMLGHVVLPAVDSENPVSLSRRAVQQIIRQSWQHDGILITDDLTMGAAYNRGLCKATVQALNAGVDLVLFAFDHQAFFDAIHCATRAREDGRLEPEQLQHSRRRLARLNPGSGP